MKETTAYQPPTKLWNVPYLLILAVSTLSSFSFYMTATIMSKYLVSLGATIAFAGVVVGLFSITSLVCRPFCGLMADRLNNIWLLIVSNILMGIGMVGFALMKSMPMMIVFRIVNAVGFAINGTVQMAAAVHFIPQDRTAEGIGYMGISQLIGSACAPAVGLEIANAWGMPAAFLAAAGMTTLAAVMLVFMLKMQLPSALCAGFLGLWALMDPGTRQHVALHDPSPGPNQIGYIDTKMSPVEVARNASDDARCLCMRQYGSAPDIHIYGDTNFTFPSVFPSPK